MACAYCGMSYRNSIHNKRNQFNYHEFVSPESEPYVPTMEERIEELERRVEHLEQHNG